MKISYAITVCNEIEEIKRLIPFLLEHKRVEDEIVVQQDANFSQWTSNDVEEYCSILQHGGKIQYTQQPLNKDFAQFKNNLTKHCSGDYIFQIDADEIPNKALLENLPEILQANPDHEVYYVPRVNTVEGLTQEHIQKWNWRVNENGWVNWPDYQMRIWKNKPEIKWRNKVHEVLEGHKNFSALPAQEELALYHPKQIERQEKQNEFYETI